MQAHLVGLISAVSLAACGTTGVHGPAPMPEGQRLRDALTGDFHGFWTGAASGRVLKAKDGGLLEVPIVLEADLDRDVHWDMDASDIGERILENAGHFNSSVWFVSDQIEVQGRRIYITKSQERYEDTLCLELVDVEGSGAMRFQARAVLARPGNGPRDACLAGAVQYDASLLLHPGPSDSPEFRETGRAPERFNAAPRGLGDAPAPEDEGDDDEAPYDENDPNLSREL